MLFDAAIEFSVVLMTAAGGQKDAFGEFFQKAADGGSAFARFIQKIQTKFQEDLARLGFAPGVIEKC